MVAAVGRWARGTPGSVPSTPIRETRRAVALLQIPRRGERAGGAAGRGEAVYQPMISQETDVENATARLR